MICMWRGGAEPCRRCPGTAAAGAGPCAAARRSAVSNPGPGNGRGGGEGKRDFHLFQGKKKKNHEKIPPKTVKRGITLGVPLKKARVFLKTRFHPARGRALRPGALPAGVPGAAHPPRPAGFFDLWVLPWPASPAFPPNPPLPGPFQSLLRLFSERT